MTPLSLTLILLAACILTISLLRRWGLPALAGYLAVGVLLAPHASQFAGESGALHTLAEFGVVLLMFTLGLEFSLGKLATLRRFVFGLGPLQVIGTAGVVMLVLYLLPSSWHQALVLRPFDWRVALVIGSAIAMSSTALVSKMLTDARELETEHGRRVFGVLLFQDLALIPLLILVPALGGGEQDAWQMALVWASVKAVVMLVLLLNFGPPLMRTWFLTVARMRSHEIFTLNVLLAALLFAWLTEEAGLSMELGAFVAGMLISETEYRYQVEEDIKPFRDLLLGLFFVTIGLRLDVGVVIASWPLVLAMLVVPVLLKFAWVTLAVRATAGTTATAIRSGLWLAQAGEFAFVLLVLASQHGLLMDASLQPMLAAMLLSILFSPLLIRQAGRITLRVSSSEWLERSVQLQKLATYAIGQRGHVVLCGYGRCGQSIAHVLETEQVPFVALDLDPDLVRRATAAGEHVVFGDSSRRETLKAAGVTRASALVVTWSETHATLPLLAQVRALAPNLPVLVRSTGDGDIELLRRHGATEVVPEIVEGSLMLASHAMALSGVPILRAQRRVRGIRDDRYGLLRGHFHGADDRDGESLEQGPLRLHTVTLERDSAAVGSTLVSLARNDVRLTAVVRGGKRMLEWPEDLMLQAGDTLVLSGTAGQVEAAASALLGQR